MRKHLYISLKSLVLHFKSTTYTNPHELREFIINILALCSFFFYENYCFCFNYSHIWFKIVNEVYDHLNICHGINFNYCYYFQFPFITIFIKAGKVSSGPWTDALNISVVIFKIYYPQKSLSRDYSNSTLTIIR